MKRKINSILSPWKISKIRQPLLIREARGSSAEVDYLIGVKGMVFPVEVKAGATGSLKSMKLFLQKYPDIPFGIRYSMHDLSFHNNILLIPLYMITMTRHLINIVLPL